MSDSNMSVNILFHFRGVADSLVDNIVALNRPRNNPVTYRPKQSERTQDDVGDCNGNAWTLLDISTICCCRGSKDSNREDGGQDREHNPR
jgi:hypothetical protein